MKKVSSRPAVQSRNILQQELAIGLVQIEICQG
jgi:hypothetical protein